MPAILTTLSIRQSNGLPTLVRAIDESGTGDGPFRIVHFVADTTGAAVNPATVEAQTAMQAAITAALSSVLKTQPQFAASGKTPVTGTLTGVANSAAFTPLNGRGFNISLWGTFAATVRLVRSFDAGATWLPLTAAGTSLMSFTAPASETWDEPESAVQYRLECTAFTSGTVNYRISQ